MGNLSQGYEKQVVWVNRFFHPDESATSMLLTDLVQSLTGEPQWRQRIVTSKASYASPGGSLCELPAGVVVHHVPALGGGNGSLVRRLANFVLFYVASLFFLLRYVRRGDVLVALTDPPLIGVIAGVVARLKGARLLHWVQDIFPETATRLGYARERGWLNLLLCRLRNKAWFLARGNVVLGTRMRDYLTENGVATDRIAVIPNWSDDERIGPVANADNAIRTAWGYATDACVVGYSGNLGRAHEITTMAAAMRQLAQRPRQAGDLRFLFIGGGARHEEMRRAVDRLPPGMVAFRPYQPMSQLSESLSVPDIHWISLQPELEGLIVPSKLYGILAVARPILFIGDPDGEVARILAEADCGASFRPGQGEAVALWLDQLAGDPERRRKLGANGRSWLEDRAGRSASHAQWHSLLAAMD